MSAPTLGTDWQLGCMELKQRGAHLLQSDQWSDCVFLVGSDTNRATIKAHKLFLACASPVFEAMFFGSMAEKDGPIEILDVQPEAFKTLLKYIYTDKAEINNFEKACSVYYAAKKYMLPYLEKDCTWYISLNLNPHNVCRAYELAQLFDEKLLMDKCFMILSTRTKEVINESNFEEADISTLNALLSQDTLNIDSELDLFRAIEKYANLSPSGSKRSLDGNDMSSPTSPNKKPKRESIEIGDVLTKMFEPSQDAKDVEPSSEQSGTVRSPETKLPEQQAGPVASAKEGQNCSFDTNNNNESLDANTAVQFAGGPARSALLSESEAFAVLMNILSSQAPVPMPTGFSTCRVPRNQHLTSQEKPDSRAEVSCRYTVLNFKTRQRSVESRAFLFLDLLWSVKLVPRYEHDTSLNEYKYYGLYINRFVFRSVLNFKTRQRSVESRAFLFLDLLWSVKLVPRYEHDTSLNEYKYYGLYINMFVFRSVLNFKTRQRSVESRAFLFLDLLWSVKLVPRYEHDTSLNEYKYYGLYINLFVFRSVLNFKTRQRSVESRAFLFLDLLWSVKLVPRYEHDTSLNEYKYYGLYINLFVFRSVLNFKTRQRSVESRAFLFLDLLWSVKLVPRYEHDTSLNEYKYYGLYINYFVFRSVLHFKTRQRSVESRAFLFLDLLWSVKLVPRYEHDTSLNEYKYYGLYIKCLGQAEKGSGTGAFSAAITARVRLISHIPSRAPLSADLRCTFTNKENVWGFDRFVTWTDAMDPGRGFVKGNALTIEAHLTAQ